MRLIFVVFIVIVLGCSSSKEYTKIPVVVAPKSKVQKIAFVTFSIYKNPNTTFKVEIIDAILVDGLLKNKNGSTKKTEFSCIQMDVNFNPIATTILDNPFVKHIEYLNESGAFQRKTIESDSAEVSLRLQLESSAKFISIVHGKETLTKIKL